MLVPVDIAVNVLTGILRSYLAETTMDHVAGALKKGGIKDLLTFFPPNRRSDPIIDTHFRGAGLPQVADWWTRKQNAIIKEDITKTIKEAFEREDQPSDVCVHFSSSGGGGGCRVSVLMWDNQVVTAVRSVVEERPLPESELVASLWQGLLAQVDWSARPDQIEGLALREVSVFLLSHFLSCSVANDVFFPPP
jgi:hypothetical protein